MGMGVANCQGQLQIMGLPKHESPPGRNHKQKSPSIKKGESASKVTKGHQQAKRKPGQREDKGSEQSDSDSEKEAPSSVSTPQSSVTSNSSRRSGPSGIPKKVSDQMRERLAMQQEELRGVKALLWESKAESGHGPWDQVIQAVKGSSGDSLDMIRTMCETLDQQRHRYKRKWQLACMMLKYKI